MRQNNLIIAAVILLVIIAGAIFLSPKTQPQKKQKTEVVQQEIPVKVNMKLASPVFSHNQNIPVKYTCDGENINPPLTISGVPTNAKSSALIMDDPDAPAGTWVHWTVWNIDPKVIEIRENSVPAGSMQGKTSFGDVGYGGPCPPSGTHRYFFKLYALDITLNISPSSTKEDLEKAMMGHILDKTELIGLYGRK